MRRAVPQADLEHAGVLLRRVRESRGISRTDISRRAGISASTLQRLEAEGKGSYAAFDAYVDCLTGEGVPGRLSEAEAGFLRRAARNSRAAREREEEVQPLHLSILKHSPAPELRRMVDHLADQRLPCGITDSLGFLHTINGGHLRLFCETSDDPFLRQWHAWHVIGFSVGPGSPFLPQRGRLELVPKWLHLYMRFVERYLFTGQSRAIVQRFSTLLPDVLPGAWRAATSLLLTYDPEVRVRTLERDGVHMILRLAREEDVSVELVPGRPTRFTLWTVQPESEESRHVLENLLGDSRRHAPLFACDYDRDGDFHINGWLASRQGRPAADVTP